MVKYSKVCRNCKMDCKNGLVDLNNPPHKEFVFDDYFVVDYLCVEFQYIIHEKYEPAYVIDVELDESDIEYLLDDAEACNDLMESLF